MQPAERSSWRPPGCPPGWRRERGSELCHGPVPEPPYTDGGMIVSSKSEIRTRLRRAWERVSRDADPVAALRAGKVLRPLLARWERVLVVEALEAGVTWQE